MTDQKKTILLYKAGSGISSVDLDALREAGFVPIKVKELTDCKLIDPLIESASASVVLQAAMKAIVGANKEKGPRTLFGECIAEKLLGIDLPTVTRS